MWAKYASLAMTSLIASFFRLGQAHHSKNFGWGTVATRLPKALSDHTATLASSRGMIYIAGGCDSPRGNEFNGDSFFCATISDALYVFNPQDHTVGTEISLPHPRYRHCAAFVNDQIWLLGGRDVDDGLLAEVDMYDIASGSWSTFTLPDRYLRSDQACFTDQASTFLYVAGGYNMTYGTLDSTFRIDTAAASAGSELEVEEMSPMSEPRGDIIAAADGYFAYLGGGFTDSNGFCAPLMSAEKYEFAANTWTNLPPLVHERGEIVMVEADGHLYALGGERQIESICDLTGTTDPGELTVGAEIVEVLENEQWSVLESFDDHKFRFAAVAVGPVIYTFGGQTAWNADCKCFKTTDDIQILGEDVPSSGTVHLGAAGFHISLLTKWTLVAATVLGCML